MIRQKKACVATVKVPKTKELLNLCDNFCLKYVSFILNVGSVLNQHGLIDVFDKLRSKNSNFLILFKLVDNY